MSNDLTNRLTTSETNLVAGGRLRPNDQQIKWLAEDLLKMQAAYDIMFEERMRYGLKASE